MSAMNAAKYSETHSIEAAAEKYGLTKNQVCYARKKAGLQSDRSVKQKRMDDAVKFVAPFADKDGHIPTPKLKEACERYGVSLNAIRNRRQSDKRGNVRFWHKKDARLSPALMLFV